MDKLTLQLPSGIASFCHRYPPANWRQFANIFLKTEESLVDYAKFCSSVMDIYSSLVVSTASENEYRMIRDSNRTIRFDSVDNRYEQVTESLRFMIRFAIRYNIISIHDSNPDLTIMANIDMGAEYDFDMILFTRI
ncbi:hypothetical protein TEA_012293 [Camellia sinensis var. sinensis]|uniref:Uncharacterized protein n=1 Tax=Camellia sinensis var. sinensis TaxID=542762 RepID=A0A4S4E8U5_CAMSN|nr:hypothetical protein TEA_012293 [Camellia sinensis var. sinensis]